MINKKIHGTWSVDDDIDNTKKINFFTHDSHDDEKKAEQINFQVIRIHDHPCDVINVCLVLNLLLIFFVCNK